MPNDGPAHNIVPKAQERKLFFVLCLTAIIMLVEVVGGYLSQSLALLADAGHMFTDVAALLLSWLAVRLGARAPDSERTFGYQRLRILAAYTNGILLFFLCSIISIEAFDRIAKPQEVDAPLMLIIAIIGFVTNLVSYFVLSGGHNHAHAGHNHTHKESNDLNIQSATIHVLSDMLGSVSAIVAALIIMFTGWSLADPILSLLVCGLIFVYAIGLVKKTTNILIESSPDKALPQKIRTILLAEVKGVRDVHHIHVWSLTEQQTIATMDILVEGQIDEQEALCSARSVLSEKLKLNHVTIQIEKGPCMGFDL